MLVCFIVMVTVSKYEFKQYTKNTWKSIRYIITTVFIKMHSKIIANVKRFDYFIIYTVKPSKTNGKNKYFFQFFPKMQYG